MKQMNRKFLRSVSLFATALLLLVGVSWSQSSQNQNEQTTNPKDESNIEKRVHASADVLDSIMKVPDKAIPDSVMKHARCIAVIPSTVRIAIGFGGEHGKGVATCRTAHGWSAPAPISITGGSWGLQLGGEAVDLVLVVMNQHGMDDLLSDKFKIGGTASAAAGPVGRDAGASTDWKFKTEMLTYSRARGIFAGVDLSGSAITQDKDETRVLYGHMVPFAAILNGKVAPPPGTHSFVATVTRYDLRAKGEKSAANTGE